MLWSMIDRRRRLRSVRSIFSNILSNLRTRHSPLEVYQTFCVHWSNLNTRRGGGSESAGFTQFRVSRLRTTGTWSHRWGAAIWNKLILVWERFQTFFLCHLHSHRHSCMRHSLHAQVLCYANSIPPHVSFEEKLLLTSGKPDELNLQTPHYCPSNSFKYE